MDIVTVSPKFQVVIPKELRQSLNIQAGQKLRARIQGEHIELIPEQPMSAARGFLAGIETEVTREKDRV
ncbi:AbrB/MazE/SpoVT family DNA-binding domain-containing protein [Methylophilus sp.]|jgi:AbrB family looped-hinge helix DNA binding protein|uniref:AbrB/MazE/SpoVT family DNA-binding domain-containing protein n=1 Tax=Methylophilus sp. TaxID=29541 RepID=UPI0011D804DE|nr:AbrB/MazE/SpoVT family DNA-binding domain-containing protein [Methylophilus sp.]TXI43510.1 MAG: AbrB/MazE/SpoVT family DNA-binding domain-containing protein [Methylophilus sp.]